MPKVTKYSSVELQLCLEEQQMYIYDCVERVTRVKRSTVLRWRAKVMPRLCQGHMKVKLDKNTKKYYFYVPT